MPTADFILFPGTRQWRIARRDVAQSSWNTLPVDVPAEAAAAIAAALQELGYDGRPVTLAMASEDCLAVGVSTLDLPKGDRRALTYRLEERLPLAAEDVVADFAPPTADGQSLAACVIVADVGPVVAALEATGVAVGAIMPAAMAAAQSLAAAGETDAVLLLDEPASDRTQLSLVILRAGHPVDWALLPAEAVDVSVHVGLAKPGGESMPRVCAFGLNEALTDAISETLGCVVHPSADSVDDAAAAFATGILGGRVSSWFDFRRDALAARDRVRQFRGPLNVALVAAATLLLAITATLLVRASAYDRAAQRYRATMSADFRSHFPGWANPANVPAVVAAERRKAQAAIVLPAADRATYGSAIATLQSLLSGLPTGERFAIDSLSVQDTSLAMTGRLTAFEQADALAAAARQSGMDVPPPQTRRAAAGTWAFVLQGTRPATTAAASGSGQSVATR